MLFAGAVNAQRDTGRLMPVDSLVKQAPIANEAARMDSVRRAFSPKKATLRSAILPGWGQIYVRHDMKKSFVGKYWKLPIIYGALGITTGVFLYNRKGYQELRYAYAAKYKVTQPNPTPADSAALLLIAPRWQPYQAGDLRNFRDEFRQNIDYSVLVFLIFWGLNVVDATVDAHLKPFDVSTDLSLRFKFGPSQMAGTTGLSLILALK